MNPSSLTHSSHSSRDQARLCPSCCRTSPRNRSTRRRSPAPRRSRLPATFSVLILFSDDPRRDVRRLERRARVDRHARLAERDGTPRPSPGARGRRLAEPEGCIGVLDVLFGASVLAVRRQLGRAVLSANSGCGPSSVRNPLGIQPPVATPNALAARHAAWFAPVSPPLMIFSSMTKTRC